MRSKCYWETLLDETSFEDLDGAGTNVKICVREIRCKNVHVQFYVICIGPYEPKIKLYDSFSADPQTSDLI